MIKSVNVGLRSLVLGSKFVLLLFLAYMLPPEDVGLYGLVVATAGYGMMALGLDFYTYANRELLGCRPSSWPTIMRDQAVLYGATYTVGIPLFLLIFHFDVLPWKVAGWFFALLATEHLGQELNRLLIAIGRPLAASVVLFIRSGLWVWAAIGIMWLDPESRRLDVVFGAWVVGATCAILLGAGMLRGLPWRERARRVNWEWIRRGVMVASIFLVATLLFKGLFVFDRFLVRSVAGDELLGVYTFYVTAAMSITAFLDAAVFSFLYPRVVASYRVGEFHRFTRLMRQLWHQTAAVTGVLLLCAAIAIEPVVSIIERPIYGDYVAIFWVLLLGVALYALGLVPHYGLYAFGRDRVIIMSHAAGFAVFLGVSVFATKIWPMEGVAAGLVAGFAVVLAIKLWRYKYWLPRLVDKDEYVGAARVVD